MNFHYGEKWIFVIVVFISSFSVYGGEECEPGRYGDGCLLDCPPNCHIHPKQSLYCDKENGKCYEGCHLGFYGDQCDQHCSTKCKQQTCTQVNGHCTSGCIDNHTGDFCEISPGKTNVGPTTDNTTTLTTTMAQTDSTSSENDIPVIIPAVIVVLLVIVGSVCIVVILKRCRKRGMEDPEVGQGLISATYLNYSRQEDTMLHIACRKRTLAEVRDILSRELVDINSRGKCGWTPVMIAADGGRRELVDILVRQGCDLSLTNDDRDTILHVVSIKGHLKIVRSILSKKTLDVNTTGHCNRTAVMAAARFGHRKVFDLLVKSGSDLSTVDSDGNNILHIACIGGCDEIVKYILNKVQVDINSKGHNGMTPVMLASYFGHLRVFQLLIRKKSVLPIINENGTNILHVACAGNNVDIVNHILRENIVSINSRDNTGKTPIMLAAGCGHTDVFKLLVKNQCDTQQVCEDGNSILHTSCALGHVDIVKCILTEGRVHIDTCGQKPDDTCFVCSKEWTQRHI